MNYRNKSLIVPYIEQCRGIEYMLKVPIPRSSHDELRVLYLVLNQKRNGFICCLLLSFYYCEGFITDFVVS